jgi:hypothetical protein
MFASINFQIWLNNQKFEVGIPNSKNFHVWQILFKFHNMLENFIKVSNLTGSKLYMFQVPQIPGFSSSTSFEVQISSYLWVTCFSFKISKISRLQFQWAILLVTSLKHFKFCEFQVSSFTNSKYEIIEHLLQILNFNSTF